MAEIIIIVVWFHGFYKIALSYASLQPQVAVIGDSGAWLSFACGRWRERKMERKFGMAICAESQDNPGWVSSFVSQKYKSKETRRWERREIVDRNMNGLGKEEGKPGNGIEKKG